jgi:uncharacterized surface protein with fasciclin (FAS1) repeats
MKRKKLNPLKYVANLVLVLGLSSQALVASAYDDKHDGKGYKPQRGVSVADITAYNGFETLNFALTATGLIDALDTRKRVTLFAPTNEAFEKLAAFLGCESVDELAGDLVAADVLHDVLLDHVTKGRRSPQSLLAEGQVAVLSGNTVAVGAGEDGIYVEGSVNKAVQIRPFITAELRARNGNVLAVNEIIVNVDPTGICGFGT